MSPGQDRRSTVLAHGSAMLSYARDAVCDFLDVREIMGVVVVVEQLDRLAVQKGFVSKTPNCCRPHGPYTIKNHRPVVSNWNTRP